MDSLKKGLNPKKRLFFRHIVKTGGMWLREKFRDDLKIISDPHLPLKNNPSKESLNEFINQINEADIVIFHANTLEVNYFIELIKYVPDLYSNAIRLSIIRDPINHLESNWSYALQEKKEWVIPHVPHLNIKGNYQTPELFGSYHTELEKNRISINEYIELYSEVYEKKIDLNLEYGYADGINIEEGQFFHWDYHKSYNIMMKKAFFNNNTQVKEIVSCFGSDFLNKPRGRYEDILFTTELISQSFALEVIENKNFKYFTKYYKDNISYSDLQNNEAERPINPTSTKFKNESNSNLNAINRYKFFIINRLDYACWEAATANRMKFLSLSNNT